MSARRASDSGPDLNGNFGAFFVMNLYTAISTYIYTPVSFTKVFGKEAVWIMERPTENSPAVGIFGPQEVGGANLVVMPRGASPKRERQYKKIARKAKKEGRYKGAKKRLLQESLTSREPRRERQKADPVAKRKAPDEDAGSSRSGVASVEDLNRGPQRTRRKRKDLDLESLRSLWLSV